MNKYIFINKCNYTIADWHRYGAEYLQNKGYSVELWTVEYGQWCDSESKHSLPYYKEENWKKFEISDLKEQLEKEKKADSIIVMLPGTMDFFPYISKCSFRYVYYASIGPIYFAEEQKDYNLERKKKLYERLIALYQKKEIWITLRAILKLWIEQRIKLVKLKKMKKCYLKSNHNHLVISATNCSLLDVPLFMRKDAEIIHALDYDRYLELERNDGSEFSNERYIVYIDNGYGNYHLEYALTDYSNPFSDDVARERLLKQINAFFDKLEAEYKIPVIVAGHSNVKYVENAFNGRKIVFNKTCELVKYSQLVIMTFSTAINFVMLYNKPFVSFYNDDFTKLDEWRTYYLGNYDLFNVCPYNIGNVFEPIEKHIYYGDKKKVEQYIERFVCSHNSKYNSMTCIEVIESFFSEKSDKKSFLNG